MLFNKNKQKKEDMILLLEREIADIRRHQEEEEIVFDEIINILQKLSQGLCGYKINNISQNNKINRIIENINNVSKYYSKYGDEAVEILIEYGNANYAHKVQTDGLSGKMGSIILGLRSLGSSISEVLALLDVTDQLNNELIRLSTTAQNLSTSSNEKATSLEETAAALEELTSTISNKTENTLGMLNFEQLSII